MYGAIEFYQACGRAGIKPIIGVETYVAPRSHLDKEARVDANPHHLILLARNLTGYRNLMTLVTKAHLDGYYYKPRIDKGTGLSAWRWRPKISSCVRRLCPEVYTEGAFPATVVSVQTKAVADRNPTQHR